MPESSIPSAIDPPRSGSGSATEVQARLDVFLSIYMPPRTEIVRSGGARGAIVKQGLASVSDDEDQAATEVKIN